MFLYVYNDYFELYDPGKLQDVLHGVMALGPITQGALLAASAAVAIPGLMIFLSLVVSPSLARWLNLVFGLLYTGIDVLTMFGSWWHYIFLNAIETVLTVLIIWYAWSWPREPSGA